MVGIILGLGALFFYVGTSVSSDWGLGPGGLIAAGAVLVVVVGVVGLFATTTVGIAAMWAMLGALIASAIEFAHGDTALGFALLLHALFFFVLQRALAIGSSAGSVVGGGSARRVSPVNCPVLKVEQGCYGVPDVTMLHQGGRGHFTLFTDGSSQFVTTSGVRWSFDSDDWAGWRQENRELLDDLPGLRGRLGDVLVLRGPMWAMAPDVYIETDNLHSWVEWLEDKGVAHVG